MDAGSGTSIELHPRLRADTHHLLDLPAGALLLHRNASLPWLILVPPGGAGQVHELEADLRRSVRETCDLLALFLEKELGSERVNVASIGNLVPQLHVHVVGRRRDDPAWPGVVWGAELPDQTWQPEQLDDLRTKLASALGHAAQ